MATQNQINALYKQYLGRDAEKAGMDYWLSSLEQGASLADVEYNIANSNEAQNYVVQEQLSKTNMLSGRTSNVTTDDEKIAQALNLLANSPDTMNLGAANALNDTRPDPVIKGEDGQLHNTNATLDANGNWSINPDEEAVYYFTQPLEDDRYNNYGEASEDYSHNYGQGNYYTEEEIKEFWDGDKGTGMELFKEQNPNLSFNDYLSFVKDSNEAYIDNPNATYADNQQNVDALANEYGIATTYADSDGQLWGFNGSGLSQTKFVDTSFDYGALIMGAAAAALTGGVAGGSISGLLGGGKLGLAGAAGASSAVGQLAATGSIDPAQTLASAVIGGINPGGMLAESFTVPDNVVGGFVQGATNDLVSNAITQGELDLQSALTSGLIGAGTNVVTDLLQDTSQFSIESEMTRIQDSRAAAGLAPLTTEELYEAATGNFLVANNTSGGGYGPPTTLSNLTQPGQSNLAGLIGPGGLFPSIDPINTTGLNTLLGGGEFLTNAVYIDSQGNQYTDTEILGMGINPDAVTAGAVPGFSSAELTKTNTIFGDAFDFATEQIPGVAQTIALGSEFLDAAANQQFESTYGFTPEKFLADENNTLADLQQIVSYGPLDELYNFSDNPRGTSQIVGLLSGIPGTYSTGANNLTNTYGDSTGGTAYIPDALTITNAQDAAAAASANAGSGSAAIINLGGTETVVSANTVLAGINTTVSDAIIDGFIDGVLVDSDANSATVSTGGNTTTNTLDTTATTIDQSTIDATTIDQSTIDATTIDQSTIDSTVVTPETVVDSTVVTPETVVDSTVVTPETVVDSTVVTPETVVDSTVVTPETVVDSTVVTPETVVDSTVVTPETVVDSTVDDTVTLVDSTVDDTVTLDDTTVDDTVTLDDTTVDDTVTLIDDDTVVDTVITPTTVLQETVVPPTTVLPPDDGGGGGGGGGGGFNFRGGTNMFEPQNIGPPGFGDPALLAAMQFPIVNYLEQYRSARQPKVNSMDGLFKDYLA